jgi:hypothetical protein
MAKTLPKRRLALQIIFILLYFQPVKLTFSAPLVGSLLENNRTQRLIPREQVSEGLFIAMTLTAIGG